MCKELTLKNNSALLELIALNASNFLNLFMSSVVMSEKQTVAQARFWTEMS